MPGREGNARFRRPQKFDYFLVLDFETTCERNTKIDPEEIIEFPCLKVNAKSLEVEATFHRYVQPQNRLSQFCSELTGIEQATVDREPPFAPVLADFRAWMEREGMSEDGTRSIFVTCGDADLKSLLPRHCEQAGVAVPECMGRWININKAFKYATGYFPKRGIPDMLRKLGLPLRGSLNSGLHNSRSIHAILCELAERGYVFRQTR